MTVNRTKLTEQEIKELPYDPRKTPDPNLELPDLAKAVIGWRSWRVATELPRFGVPPKLYSASFDYYWTPRRAAEATCEGHKSSEAHEVPDERCTCGFYSAKNLKHLLSMGYPYYYEGDPSVTVIGKIANWGKVIEGGQGWRSEFAYPVQLYVPYEAWHLANPLKEAYDVKTVPLNWLKERR